MRLRNEWRRAYSRARRRINKGETVTHGPKPMIELAAMLVAYHERKERDEFLEWAYSRTV